MPPTPVTPRPSRWIWSRHRAAALTRTSASRRRCIKLRGVARERGLSEEAVRRLIAAHTEERQFGILGEPRVNVLALNLALDGEK